MKNIVVKVEISKDGDIYMDYKGWVLSIYDEYIKRYDDKYKKEEKKRTFKEILGIMFKKGNRFITSMLIVFVVSISALGILFVTGKMKNAGIYMIIDCSVIMLIFYSQNYKYETDIKTYHNRVDILREVLIDEDLYNEEFIKELRKYTGSMFYKINERIRGVLKSLIGIASMIGFNYTFIKLNQNIVLIIVLIILTIIAAIYYVYMYLVMIPNSRITRRQQFHIILSILIAYDFESKRSKKKENSESQSLQDIKEKNIILNAKPVHINRIQGPFKRVKVVKRN